MPKEIDVCVCVCVCVLDFRHEVLIIEGFARVAWACGAILIVID
jgi:hypothetical protein